MVSPTSKSSLLFQNVSKRYGDRLVLDDVSFEINAGQSVAIMGRSGSGKSTLLHLAAGIDTPTSGDVKINGVSVGGMSEHQRTLMRRDDVGLVFQFFYLLPHLSVRDNIALPNLIADVSTAETQGRVRALLETVGLVDRADDPVQKLSGGEMQRVAICRALLRRPNVLLADEPTGNLDDATGQSIMKLLFDVTSETKTALIYVTHSRDIAASAERVWSLHNGRLGAA